MRDNNPSGNPEDSQDDSIKKVLSDRARARRRLDKIHRERRKGSHITSSPKTDLLEQLLEPTGLNSHILTSVGPNSENISTAIYRTVEGELEIEHPQVIRLLEKNVKSGSVNSIILRSFDYSRFDEFITDRKVPYKILRGWVISEKKVAPISKADLFSAMCTDHKTGDMLPPEPATEYGDTWTINPLRKL